MRNLTIKRTKSFVGCLVKMKVYVENPSSGDFTINNTLCSKLGEVKNGEEKTFQIEEQAVKVFVIADKISKGYCNDYYQLSDGQEDVFLTGKNCFNPANGNAFRFDNNESEAVSTNRKHGTRKGAIVFALSILVGAVVGSLVAGGFFLKAPKEKVFSSNGMNITLSEAFKEATIENYTVAYDSKKVAVFALKEPFALEDGFEDITLDQYADFVIQANGLSEIQKKTDNGLIWFDYDLDNPEANGTYRYFTYVYKTNDAFWMVQFATLKSNAEKESQEIAEWAIILSPILFSHQKEQANCLLFLVA